MPTLPVRALRALCFFFCLSLLLSATARAELVWTPQTGWHIESGALSGLTGTEGKKALEMMNAARTKEEKGSRGGAIRIYKKVAKKYPNSIYAPEALYRAAHLYMARRQYVKGWQFYQDMLSRYPNTPRFNEVIGEEYRVASAMVDGARPRYFGWIPGFRNREKGLEMFEYIILNAPYSDYAPLALMNVARGHIKMHNTEEAIDALDRMINNYPTSILAPDAYLKMAQTHASLVDGPAYDQANTKDASTYYEDFTILFPNDPNVSSAAKGMNDMKTVLAESKITMGDFYFYKRDNFIAAKVFYNEAITIFPESPVAEKAKKRLAAVDVRMESLRPKIGPDGKPIMQKRKWYQFF
jgi:outer membrane protein assembly factor BamD